MRILKKLILLFSLHFTLIFAVNSALLAQETTGTVRGNVFDEETSEPLISTAVYLSGTTIGVASDTEGEFILRNVPPGIYELVVRYVGYEQVTIPFEIKSGETIYFNDISLRYEAVIMDDVVVEARRDQEWLEHYSLFKRSFLGQSENAAHTEIMNPEILDFTIHQRTLDLIATAKSELHIVNHALGYELYTDLDSFSFDTNYDNGFYYHRTRFVELEPDDPQQQEMWEQNRQKTYNGSFKHFLSCLIDGSADEVFNIENGDVTHVNTRNARAYGSNIRTEQLVFLVETRRQIPLLVGYQDRLRSEIDFTSFNVLLVDRYGNLLNPNQVILYGDWALERMADLLPTNLQFTPSD